MSLQSHLSMIEEKHHKLDGWIAQENNCAFPDFGKLQTWKKQKLLLKEELERLRLLERMRLDAA